MKSQGHRAAVAWGVAGNLVRLKGVKAEGHEDKGQEKAMKPEGHSARRPEGHKTRWPEAFVSIQELLLTACLDIRARKTPLSICHVLTHVFVHRLVV